jgi:hypothetical protein
MKERLHKAIPVWLYWKLPLKAQIWLADYPRNPNVIVGRYFQAKNGQFKWGNSYEPKDKWEHSGLFSTREDR